ncbi:Methyltransferase type 11 [Macrophomina phaseolina MS6]|uniref:Methyltransferase type 11 n=1 Tax=Macrophomina phaseolina (strain MS6) TaxID=1126212 RepID=K2SPR6_MACPH|nr:Methyltransferase type 11 [Macrophomina phaseolina MS6]
MPGKLYNAPVNTKKMNRALDLGTGTGIWAVDFADEFPECEVVGTDLSPIQPSWVPPNCRFLVDDAEADWTDSKPYDFIHIRTLSGSIADWPRLLKQAYDNTSPGGWIEMQEFEVRYGCDDDSYPAKAPDVHNYMRLLREVRKDPANRECALLMHPKSLARSLESRWISPVTRSSGSKTPGS